MLLPILFYLFFLIIYGVFSAIFIYHLNEFGYHGDASRPVLAAYFVLTIIIIIITVVLFILARSISA
jgi:hypothetical protein